MAWSRICELTRVYTTLQYVGDLIGANAKDVVFTSGATESNNMSVKGIARFYKGKKKHMYVLHTVLHAPINLY